MDWEVSWEEEGASLLEGSSEDDSDSSDDIAWEEDFVGSI